nr:MAG TPA: hypothetical protein [Caudoviricetes sp.]
MQPYLHMERKEDLLWKRDSVSLLELLSLY